MSLVTVKKFPVIWSDGTQYQVKIEEVLSYLYGKRVKVSLYVKRRFFGFRRVFSKTYEDGGVYRAKSPDYTVLTTRAVMDHYVNIERSEQKRLDAEEEAAHKEKAWQQFEQWDGKV